MAIHEVPLHEIAGVQPGPCPDLSIVTFRLCPDAMDADIATRALLAAIHQDGRVFLTSTMVDGRFTIRMAILTYHAHIEDVDLALQVIDECAALIRNS